MIRLGVVGHQGYPELGAVLATLGELAPRLNLQPVLERELHAAAPVGDVLEDMASIDALLTLGGDGTLLRGARLLGTRSVPIIGINLGRLGFLTCCQASEIGEALERAARTDSWCSVSEQPRAPHSGSGSSWSVLAETPATAITANPAAPTPSELVPSGPRAWATEAK